MTFRDEYVPAFEAWLATDPFNNPDAPARPVFMPQYKISLLDQANQLETQAEQLVVMAQDASQKSDYYILNTVFLATALLFTAITLRFVLFKIRVVMLSVAFAIFLFGMYRLVTLLIS